MIVWPKESKLYREALQLAYPVILSMLSVTIMANVDIIMVGRLGKEAVGAAGLANWVFLIVYLTFKALETGTQAIVARRFGEGQYQQCGRTCANALAIGLILGLAFFALMYSLTPRLISPQDAIVRKLGIAYLHYRLIELPFSMMVFGLNGFYYGIGKPKVPMVCMVISNVTNVLLNYMLIFGKFGAPQMGVAGAGLASSLATISMVLLFIIYTLVGRFSQRYAIFRERNIDIGIIKALARLSTPVAIQGFFVNLGFLIFLYINEAIGVEALATSNIVLEILMFSFMPAVGFGVAAATLLGQRLGAGQPRQAEHGTWASLALGCVCMGTLGIVYIIFGAYIMRAYISDPGVIRSGALVLKIVGAVQIFDACGIILSKALQSAGLTRFVMLAEVVINWFIFLPSAYVLGLILKMDVLGSWFALVIYIVAFALTMLVRFKRGDWKHVRI
jgi:MATE family multidrug resistance protein